MKNTGTTHKVISVILRFIQFASAVIVLGVLGHFVHLLDDNDGNTDGRIIYAMVVAGIGIVYSLLFIAPVDKLFLSFPADFVLFIMWLVAFCLLQDRTGTENCTSGWYYNYWGYYWVGPVSSAGINGSGCAEWRTVLAFSFIACFFHVFSGILGAYVFATYIKGNKTKHESDKHAEKLHNHSRETSHEQQAADDQPPTALARPAVPVSNV
jgi:hypothetical protein